MTLSRGNFIGKLVATSKDNGENCAPRYTQELVEPPVVTEGEMSRIFQVETAVFSHDLGAYVIVAKEVR